MEANSEVMSLLRHLGTVVAGALISKGWISASLEAGVVGLVIAAGVALLAVWNKRTAKTQKAETAAVALALPSRSTDADLNAALARQELPPVDLTVKT